MGKNDDKIIMLRKQIEDKKSTLKRVGKFIPITNCTLPIDEVRYNLNVLTDYDLTMLLLKLNIYKISAENLKLDNVLIGGYQISEWMSDIKAKLEILNYNKEERMLKQLETKLTTMLSEEKKTELELDEIEKMLK